jgi:gamma-glutamyltranspeptidase/glutathione hydrolase
VVVRQPLSLEYRGVRIHTNPAPASGGLMVAFGLRLLEQMDMAGLGFGSEEHIALIASAIRETGEARLDLAAAGGGESGGKGDEAMLDREFLETYRRRVAGQARARRGTTQISVIDAAGNLASLTVSNGEGSGYVVPGTGVVMNNMLGEEDLNPGGFHRWPCARRMTSMMAPTAVEWPAEGAGSGRLVATGSGGSNRIRSTLLQVLVNLIDFAMPLEEAVRAPRLHVEDDVLSAEGGFDLDHLGPVLEAYASVQLWDQSNMYFGGAHSVEVSAKGDEPVFTGAGDPRRGGCSLPG